MSAAHCVEGPALTASSGGGLAGGQEQRAVPGRCRISAALPLLWCRREDHAVPGGSQFTRCRARPGQVGGGSTHGGRTAGLHEASDSGQIGPPVAAQHVAAGQADRSDDGQEEKLVYTGGTLQSIGRKQNWKSDSVVGCVLPTVPASFSLQLLCSPWPEENGWIVVA